MNKSKYVKITKDILGEDIFEVLEKAEVGSGIFKQGTKTALDPEEIKIALQIVPRAVLSFLIAHLKPLEVGGTIDLELPFCDGQLHVNKLTHDVYGGYVVSKGQRQAEFQYRSLPSIGLILLSTFELYDMAEIGNIRHEVKEDKEDKYQKLQDIIDERLKLKALIQSVVDQRISEREAIQKLIADKLAEQFEAMQDEDEEIEDEDDVEGEPLQSEEQLSVEIPSESGETMEDSKYSKKSKLREFLDNREKRRQEKVELDKSEHINCPDCGTDLYKGEKSLKLCICYGEHHNKEIKFKKSENGKVKFKFPKSFDIDNVEMLLDAIKSNK